MASNTLDAIRVEFFGIPRQRAGVAQVDVPCDDSMSLNDLLAVLTRQFPDLAAECFRDGRIREGYIASLDGRQFVTDPSWDISSGESLLIMSSDAGG